MRSLSPLSLCSHLIVVCVSSWGFCACELIVLAASRTPTLNTRMKRIAFDLLSWLSTFMKPPYQNHLRSWFLVVLFPFCAFPFAPCLLPYSYLSATIGSTLVARRAGSKQATSATAVNRAAARPYVHGSLGCTPNNIVVKLSRYLVSTYALATPRPTPISVRL